MESSTGRALLTDFLAVSRGRAVLAAFLALAAALLEGFGISLLVPLLALLFGSGALPAWLRQITAQLFELGGAGSMGAKLGLLLGLFLLVMLARAVLTATRDITVTALQVRFVEGLRLRVATALVGARWDAVARLRHARIAHLMNGDIQRIGFGLQFFLQLGVTVAVVLVQYGVALMLAPWLSLLFLPVLAAGVLALMPLLRHARAMGHQAAEANFRLLDHTGQFMAGLKHAISQNRAPAYLAQTRYMLTEIGDRQIAHIRKNVAASAALVFLTALAGAVLILVDFAWVAVSPPILITQALILSRLTSPLAQFQQGAQQWAQTVGLYDHVRSLTDALSKAVRPESGRIGAPLPAGAIVLDEVGFHHPDGEGGIDDFSLVLRPGEWLGVTGATGSGKTTLADLLAGLYPPQRGRILVGGVALDDASVSAWRDVVSYVSQEPFLTHATIRENLGGGDEAALWQALDTVGASELVRRLGLDGTVGERGALLSGGERQRIALTQALLRRPRLLLLDEATSAIDIAGERALLRRLRSMVPPVTLVLIAHRAESLEPCDRILHLGRDAVSVPVRSHA